MFRVTVCTKGYDKIAFVMPAPMIGTFVDLLNRIAETEVTFTIEEVKDVEVSQEKGEVHGTV